MNTDNAPQDYVPVDEWPSVSTMLDGFGDQTLPASDALTGRTLTLVSEDGRTFELAVRDASTLTWTVTANGSPQALEATYKAIEARPGIFIIDLVHGADAGMHDVTIVVNVESGSAMLTDSQMQVEGATSSATTAFTHAVIDGTQGRRFERSAGLVGKRIYYRYSDVEAYEHIYLSPGTFVWHCIRGGEQGLADVDRTMTFEVADDLFLFYWSERVMTVESVLLIDLREQRSIGRMFGWDDTLQRPLVLPFNSRLSVLNTTDYPQDHEKH